MSFQKAIVSRLLRLRNETAILDVTNLFEQGPQAKRFEHGFGMPFGSVRENETAARQGSNRLNQAFVAIEDTKIDIVHKFQETDWIHTVFMDEAIKGGAVTLVPTYAPRCGFGDADIE